MIAAFYPHPVSQYWFSIFFVLVVLILTKFGDFGPKPKPLGGMICELLSTYSESLMTTLWRDLWRSVIDSYRLTRTLQIDWHLELANSS